VEKLTALIETLVSLAEASRDISDPLAELHKFTGSRRFNAHDFRMLCSAMSAKELATEIAQGEPGEIGELTRAELVELLGLAGKPGPKQTFYLGLLSDHFPNAYVSDIIFWPDRERTEEEMADEILHRQKLCEEGGIAAVRSYLVGLAQEVMADPASPPWAKTWAAGYFRQG